MIIEILTKFFVNVSLVSLKGERTWLQLTQWGVTLSLFMTGLRIFWSCFLLYRSLNSGYPPTYVSSTNTCRGLEWTWCLLVYFYNQTFLKVHHPNSFKNEFWVPEGQCRCLSFRWFLQTSETERFKWLILSQSQLTDKIQDHTHEKKTHIHSTLDFIDVNLHNIIFLKVILVTQFTQISFQLEGWTLWNTRIYFLTKHTK